MTITSIDSRRASTSGFSDPARCREELGILQPKLRGETGLLADVAWLEDLTRLEMQS